ncbi:MAG: hypothetical protein ACLTLQ_22240 [[Clostridium] scindens]
MNTFYTCRQMGIEIPLPDINSEGGFSVDNGNIRYGLAAIKSIGKPVIQAILTEREARGEFKNMKDFIERLSGKEVNKRTIESFIKSGAFDASAGPGSGLWSSTCRFWIRSTRKENIP